MIIRDVLLTLLLLLTSTSALLKPPQKTISPSTSPIKGISLPPIGLGLWNTPNTSAIPAITTAFHTGYIHFDSASAYHNEPSVGLGLSTTNLSRSDYWLTSKLWNTHHRPPLVREAINQTLHDLNTTHLDLYLMHWPVAFRPDTAPGRDVIDQDTTLLSTWTAMESLVSANLTRYIGISNFSPRQIDMILKSCVICPFAHEFETHPYLQQQEFVEWHQQHNISVIAYSPLANLNPTYNGTHSDIPSILEDPFWLNLAGNHSVTVPQAVLAWNRQRGVAVIPKSTHKKYIEQNFASSEKEVKFSDEEMVRISEEDRKARFNDPSKGWGVELFEGLDGGGNRFVGEAKEL